MKFLKYLNPGNISNKNLGIVTGTAFVIQALPFDRLDRTQWRIQQELTGVYTWLAFICIYRLLKAYFMSEAGRKINNVLLGAMIIGMFRGRR
jgi:hypothetical protein